MKEWAPTEVEFYKKKYVSASKGNYDIYVVFVEKGVSILNTTGFLGYILPNKFFTAEYGLPLRTILSEGKNLQKIVDFGYQQVFSNATTYTCLLFLNKRNQNSIDYEEVNNLEDWKNGINRIFNTITSNNFGSSSWYFISGFDESLFIKMRNIPNKLEDVASRIFQGLKTGADPVFILEEKSPGKLFSKELNREIVIEDIYLKPLYKSGNFKRYKLHKSSRYVIFPYRNGSLISWDEIKNKAPNTANYLLECKNSLAKRENGKWVGKNWYCFSRNQALEIISSPKILTADLNPHANYCFDELGSVTFPGGAAGGYGIVISQQPILFVLGLLNSKLVDYYHKKISSNFRGGWFGYDAKIIRNIPIRTIDFTNPQEVEQHDRMVSLVERMLELHKREPQTPQEADRLQREIAATDAAIDKLVYELYGLTEEEVRIVEGGR